MIIVIIIIHIIILQGHRALLYGLNETEASHIITDASLLKTLLKVVEGYEGLTCIIYSGTPSQDDLNGFILLCCVVNFLSL
jgi:hypothetical protein